MKVTFISYLIVFLLNIPILCTSYYFWNKKLKKSKDYYKDVSKPTLDVILRLYLSLNFVPQVNLVFLLVGIISLIYLLIDKLINSLCGRDS